MNNSIFQLWKPNSNNNNNTKSIKTMNLNFGPQHPAAHGVLRLILQLNGEVIERLDPHIGLLHRGTEKLIEDRNYLQGLPYFDRLDYVSMLSQEHSYCLAIESLLNKNNYSSLSIKVRTIFDEITRILNHLLAVACHALDIGSMSSILWSFEEREKLMEFYERVSGARMHAAFYRPVKQNNSQFTQFLLQDIIEFNRNFLTTLNEMHNVLTFNKIWKQRLINIGTINKDTCINYGLTGVMSRSVGINRDLRMNKFETYANYFFLNFRGYTGQHGDSYDRFLIRMNEMAESLNIMNQSILNLNIKTKKKSLSKNNINKLNSYLLRSEYLKLNNKNNYNSMENLIHHFKEWSEGDVINSNISYKAIEAPKGEFGVTLVSDNSNKPYRCKIRTPALHHLQLLNKVSRGHFLADLAALIGTVDIVFGEIDR